MNLPFILNPVHHAFIAGITAFLITFFLTPWVRRISIRQGWVSRTREERWGRRVIARLGGVAMFLGFLVAVLIFVPLTKPLWGLLIGLGMIFILGLADDLYRLPPYVKLLVQLVVGCVVVACGVRIELIEWVWLSIPLSVLWFVFCINAFNLLDNMDGLAAGTGALAAGFCAWFAIVAGQWPIVVLGIILCGVCLGFLRFNFPPAKIYMGDSGSHFLGLSLSALALMGSWQHSTQLLSVLAVPALVLAVPIFDTCFVTIQRLVHRRHPFSGGADHVSHRLAILGLSVKQTVAALCAISACLGVLSIVSATMQPLQALVIWLAVLTVLILFGLYLGQVKVYRLERTPSDAQDSQWVERSTLVETMLMHKRRLLEILVDFTLVSVAYVFAHLLRFEGTLSQDIQQIILQSLPIIVVLKLTCFAGFGVYRGVWRYVSLEDIIVIFKAVSFSSILSALALLYIWRFEGYSRAALIIDGTLTFILVGASRVLGRVLDAWILNLRNKGEPILIVGAGDMGARVLRNLKYEAGDRRRVIGFIDDDIRKHGERIHGARVIASRNRLSATIMQYGIGEVLVAIREPSGELMQQMRHTCEPLGVKWRVVRSGIMDV